MPAPVELNDGTSAALETNHTRELTKIEINLGFAKTDGELAAMNTGWIAARGRRGGTRQPPIVISRERRSSVGTCS
jgi:hypothetical protein